MERTCCICGKSSPGLFRCPTCPFTYYCCAKCCRQHREMGCEVVSDKKLDDLPAQSSKNDDFDPKYITADTVPLEKLQLLKDSQALKNLLSNPHLRNLLIIVDMAKDPEKIMEKAMQEPLFLEFADACLEVVEPESKDE